jgi:outer membrane protein assembly factor BamB
MKSWRYTILFVLLLLSISFAYSADWNQWRGSNRDAATLEFKPPKVYPEQLKQIWSVPVGIGHSSPVISGSSVYAFTRMGEQETLSGYDLASGKLLWKDSYDAPYTMNPAAMSHGKGPKSTPILDDGKIYTFGISGILSCYDASKGKLLWRNDFKKQFPVTFPDFGTAMSPAIDRGLLFVHAGGPDKGAILALNAETGEQKWSWDGDGPAYASPIVVELGGVRQLVTQTQQNIVGLSVSNGQLLWKIPFTTEYVQNIVTPVLYKDLLIFSGLEKGVFAVRLMKEGNQWTPKTVWQNDRAAMYMSSPVIVGDYLYGMTHYRKGQFFCLDARTGATQWTSTGDEGDYAAIVNASPLLLFLGDDAELTIANATEKKFDVLKKYTVAKSPIWAYPAIHGNQIVIKDQDSLTLFSFE